MTYIPNMIHIYPNSFSLKKKKENFSILIKNNYKYYIIFIRMTLLFITLKWKTFQNLKLDVYI